MKIVTFSYESREQIGYLVDHEQRVLPFAKVGILCDSVNELIERYPLNELLKIVEINESKVDILEESIDRKDVSLCAPIPCPKQDIICLGINYLAHAEESARYKKEAFDREKVYPIYFSKRVNRAVADGESIDAHVDMLENLDYECELAVVTCGNCKKATPKTVKDYIFGYTIVNDISAREIQTRHKQWYFGKSLDDFTPIGPCIVTADEISYPPKLAIKSYVNGQLRQDSNTKLLINNIDYIITELSRGMTLLPATIISTGTPAGVGMGFEPPKFLKPGDVVTCQIEAIGTLTNTIMDKRR